MNNYMNSYSYIKMRLIMSNKYKFKVSIDCAECALKVEEALKKTEGVKNAYYNYPKGELKVETTLSEDEIKNIALSVEEDMKFYDEEEESESKLILIRIILSVVILLISYITKLEWLALLSWIISGYDVIWKAIKNILKGKVFDENFLMSIATIAAISIKYFDEGAAVMIFYQIGEYFQDKAVSKSRKSIKELLDLSSDEVTLFKNDEWITAKPEEVCIGDKILLKSGEKLALDGIVKEGDSFLDTKALTGEGVPVHVKRGDKVLSGSLNTNNSLVIEVTELYKDSTAMKIMRLAEESEGKKAKSERFITVFSKYYTPLVCLSALLVFLLPPLFSTITWSDSLYRAAMLLVISCPCALVLSVPLTYFSSLSAFSKKGILMKGDEAIQRLSKLNSIALDKTGTLTEGVFAIQDTLILSGEREHLISVASSLERESTHPIAQVIVKEDTLPPLKAENVVNIPGVGIKGNVNGKEVIVGNEKILSSPLPLWDKDGTLVYVTENNILLGILCISDKIRDNASSSLSELKRLGIKKVTIISGDRKERVEKTRVLVGADEGYGELLPDQKLEKLESLMGEGITLAYCGDGINDAPALKRADVGIAMGGVGSDSAIESADVVIMNDDISHIVDALRISKKTEKIVKENIVFSLLIKFMVFVLAIFGLASMWLSVFADTGVCILAILNSIRAMRFKKN